MLKILADQAIPNAKEIFSSFGDVILKPGRQIEPDDLKDVDALMVRSITKVNERMLAQADKLRFVGTATAGVDHIDRSALERRGIAFSAAFGCNAQSVADYVLSVWMVLAQRYSLDFSKMSLGIVGCGHVGLRVYSMAKALGMQVVCSDIPRKLQLQGILDSVHGKGDPRFKGMDEMRAAAHLLSEGDDFLCKSEFADPELFDHSLDEVLDCDIISLHVPLTYAGQDSDFPTYHMLSYSELSKLKSGQILINTSRGAVIDNQALYDVLIERKGSVHAWLDVFENEPDIKVKGLIPYLEGCTAHIAGYALEAKNRGTTMIARACKELLKLKQDFVVPKQPGDITKLYLDSSAVVNNDLLSRLVFSVYDVRRDDSLFRTKCYDASSFDNLRYQYQERHELNTLKIVCATPDQVRKLYHLGFRVSSVANTIANAAQQAQATKEQVSQEQATKEQVEKLKEE